MTSTHQWVVCLVRQGAWRCLTSLSAACQRRGVLAHFVMQPHQQRYIRPLEDSKYFYYPGKGSTFTDDTFKQLASGGGRRGCSPAGWLPAPPVPATG